MKSIPELKKTANQLRIDVVRMLAEAGSGHPGGSLSSAEIVTALYFDVMKHNPKNPGWSERDYFILSKGHCAPVQYAAMARSGYFPVEELMTLRKLNSRLQGHPSRKDLPGIETSTGSLGQGLSVAVGICLGLKLDKMRNRVYCLMGDGEQDEGQVWEAAMAAAHFKLDNLCGIVDVNGLQIDGFTKEVMNIEPLAKKYESFCWHVLEIDGHDIEEVLTAFEKAKTAKNRPTVIIAHTIKGRGVSFMENQVGWHGKAPTKEDFALAVAELEKND